MSHLGHSSHSAASDGSASALKSVRKLAIAGFLQIVLVHFQRPSSSISTRGHFLYIVSGGETPLLFCWGWGRRSDFAGSDVRWVHNLFSIIKTPTTNQGKRGSMSYIVLFHWQPLKAIIYFSVWSTWIWLFFIPFSNYQSHREDIAFLNSWLWFSNSSFSHGIFK
jgi:hypothetical protein